MEVNVHNYVNPVGRCDGCQAGNNPGCCDEDFVRPASQGCPSTGPAAAVCDPFIAYCSVPLGDPTCDPNTEGSTSAFFRSDTNSRAVTTMRHLRQLPPRSNQEVQCSVQTLFWPQSHALTTHLLLHMTASCAPKLWLLLES